MSKKNVFWDKDTFIGTPDREKHTHFSWPNIIGVVSGKLWNGATLFFFLKRGAYLARLGVPPKTDRRDTHLYIPIQSIVPATF